MNNFYSKHKKLLSVLLVAVFVVGGVLFCRIILAQTQLTLVGALESSYSPYGYPPYSLYIDGEENYYVEERGDYVAGIGKWSSSYFKIPQWYGQVLNNNIKRNKDQTGFVVTDYQGLKSEQVGNVSFSPTGEEKPEGATPVEPKPDKPGKLQELLGSMLAWLLYYIAVGLGWIMMLITKVMLAIGVFNSFLKQPAVLAGWTITRDICNNFFIVFMMILAAGVTLHLPNYAWRTMLPKILIYAVLINFSMMITGVLIDVSQIIMLTFASPLATVHGYNIIISAFNLPNALAMEKVLEAWADGKTGQLTNRGSIDFFDIVAALLFAIIVTIVAIVVITCITLILVYRIVMLMFLVILSPLYFLSKASNISALGQIGTEWMGKLSSMLTVGPAMMFFLYLSFLTMSAANNLGNTTGQTSVLPDTAVAQQTTNAKIGEGTAGGAKTSPLKSVTVATPNTEQYVALSNMATVQGVLNFLIVVGLLWASLMMGKKFGDAAAGVAGKGMGWLGSAAKKYSGFNLGKNLGQVAINRGKEFAGDVTGVAALSRGVQQYFKGNAQKREEARNLRAQAVTGKIQAGAAAVKSPFAKATTWLKDNTWNREAKRQEAEVNEGKAKMNQLTNAQVLEKIDKKEEFEHNGNRYEYDAGNNTWDIINNTTGVVAAYNVANDRNKLTRMLTATQNTSHLQDIKDKKDFTDATGNKFNWNGTAWEGKDSAGGSLIIGGSGQDNDLLKFRNNKEAELIGQVESGKDFKRNGLTHEWDSANHRWKEKDKNGNYTGSVIDYADRDKIYTENGGVTAQDLENKEERLSQQREKIARREKYARWAITAASTIAGGFALPSVLLGAGAGLVAGKAATGLGSGLAHAGEQDLKLARNYKADQVEARRKDLKDLDDDEITAKMDDYTLDKFTRMAASMEALSRGILSKTMAQRKKDEILELSRNDAKMTKNLDTELQKNYIDLSRNFTDLADITKRDRAQLKIGGDVASGKIAMKDLDPMSLTSMAERFADTLSRSRFTAQFKDLADAQKEAITNALKASVAGPNPKYSQREKLAGAADFGVAFTGATPADKAKYLGKLSTKEIEDMIGNNEAVKLAALKAAIGGNQNLLAESVKNAIAAGGSRGDQLRRALL